MPLKTWNTFADWNASYQINAEPNGHPNTRGPVILNYHRAVILPGLRSRVAGLTTALGWIAPGPALVIVGAGFGWLAELLETESGFTRVVALDPSIYIQTNKAGTEEADINAGILAVGLSPTSGEGLTLKGTLYDGAARTRSARGVLNELLDTNQSRNRVRTALGAVPEVVLTESVLESLTDAECQTLSTRAHAFSASVQLVHLVITDPPPPFNAKTLAQWKALLPGDLFVSDRDYSVL